jgi:hypothetical protein
MRKRISAVALATATVSVLALGLLAADASADRAQHSQHVRLLAVGGAPLKGGFVENIHANGPVVFAHELYVLRGAEPNTTYHVTINLFPFDSTCAAVPVLIPTTTLTTNGAGNGVARHTFAPSDVPPAIRNATHGGYWTITSATSSYRTACGTVTLD